MSVKETMENQRDMDGKGFDGMNFEKIGAAGGKYIAGVRRDVMKMTQSSFAGLLGISVPTLQKWENGVNAVPEYVLRAVRVMAADPGTALSALNAGVCADPDDQVGWESGRTSTARAREDAVAWMRRDETRVSAMEMIDGLMEFERHYRDLGYPSLSATDLLLLAACMELERVNGKLDALLENRAAE